MYKIEREATDCAFVTLPCKPLMKNYMFGNLLFRSLILFGMCLVLVEENSNDYCKHNFARIGPIIHQCIVCYDDFCNDANGSKSFKFLVIFGVIISVGLFS